MVHSITLFSALHRLPLEPVLHSNALVIDCASFVQDTTTLTIEIEFSMPIVAFRNHDYTWLNATTDCLSTAYSPKLIQLENGIYVQANLQQGIWEFQAKKSTKLFWKFNPTHEKPVTIYTGKSNEKVVVDAQSKLQFDPQPTLLFVSTNPIEFSRSIIPFSAIACFTDHCDFDTLANLELQRSFFAARKIKITKGFFLTHFSKRADNASYEKDASALDLWRQDGHELCYHSLSQSIKPTAESFSDFEEFQPPYTEISTWIDHGYQPYNLSLYQNFGKSNAYFESVLHQKNITTLWNYIDCGTATTSVINQLNPNHFTLNRFLQGNKSLGFVKRLQLMVKNIIFHYFASETIILRYKNLATSFKKIVYKKQLAAIPKLISDLFSVGIPLFSVLFFWKNHKNRPYKFAHYNPILFRHTIFEKEVFVFQTLEMVDFKKALSPVNLDLLIAEHGLFIAHTYFSVPMEYHQGKLFKTTTEIDATVAQNFDYLAQKIEEKALWNPTLAQLISYLSQFEKVVLTVDAAGTVSVQNGSNLIFRSVQNGN